MNPTEGCYFITKSHAAAREVATVESVLSNAMPVTAPGYMDAKYGGCGQFDGVAGGELAITLTHHSPDPEADEGPVPPEGDSDIKDIRKLSSDQMSSLLNSHYGSSDKDAVQFASTVDFDANQRLAFTVECSDARQAHLLDLYLSGHDLVGPLGPKKERYLMAIARRESRLEKDMKAQEARDVPTSADDLLTTDDIAMAMEEEPRTQRGRGAFLADTDYELTGADKEDLKGQFADLRAVLERER